MANKRVTRHHEVSKDPMSNPAQVVVHHKDGSTVRVYPKSGYTVKVNEDNVSLSSLRRARHLAKLAQKAALEAGVESIKTPLGTVDFTEIDPELYDNVKAWVEDWKSSKK